MRAHTTGSFAVFSRDDGKDVTPNGRKARALLAYLVANGGTKVSKGMIVGLLWGDRGDQQARSSLRQVLMELRRLINASREIVASDREHIWIIADTLIEHPADESCGYKEAFGDLDGITPDFDEWLAAERARRSRRRTTALRAEAAELLGEGRGEDSLALIERVQEIDPNDEDALRLAMNAEFERGHPAAIAERYRTTASLMYADLGVEPSQEMRVLRDRLIARLTDTHEHEHSNETDQGYFRRRASEEHQAAAAAETEVSRKIHSTLRDRYQRIALPQKPERDLGTFNGKARTARFLRKSLIIQAVRWFKDGDHPAVLPGSAANGTPAQIDTPEGRLTVDAGDWIITGISGENYPCKPDIFEQLYTPVD